MKVDFHILPDQSAERGWLYACSLIEAAYLAHEPVVVCTANVADAQKIDELLWTYREDSFIPHAIIQDNNDPAPPPVQITSSSTLPAREGTLINLNPQFSGTTSSFTRLIEIVFFDPTMQQLARNRFKQYRERGHDLHTHKITTV